MKITDPTVLDAALHRATQATPQQAPDPKTLHAAQEFEQIFLRKMLSSIEKSGHASSEGAATAGSDVYSSMVVNALSEAISKGGGIGLADVIARTMTLSTSQHGPDTPTPATGAPASNPSDAVTTPAASETPTVRTSRSTR